MCKLRNFCLQLLNTKQTYATTEIYLKRLCSEDESLWSADPHAISALQSACTSPFDEETLGPVLGGFIFFTGEGKGTDPCFALYFKYVSLCSTLIGGTTSSGGVLNHLTTPSFCESKEEMTSAGSFSGPRSLLLDI